MLQRPLATLAALCVLGGCAARPSGDALSSDSAGGEVPPDSALVGVMYHGDRYVLRSDLYARWREAQAALDSLPEPANLPRIDVHHATDAQIDSTITFLEDRGPERRAIERAGFSVRDYVLTSLALGSMLVRSGEVADSVRAPLTQVHIDRGEIERARDASRYHVLFDDDDGAHAGRRHEGHGHDKHRGHGHKHGHGKHS